MRACPSGSSAATFISTPIRRMRSACCARATSGQAAAEPAITFMKSRRRITSPRVLECADFCLHDYNRDLRPAEWEPEVILRGNNPKHRMSALGHKRTFAVQNGMSALPPKATSNATYGDVRFGPKADIAGLFDHFITHSVEGVGDVRFGSKMDIAPL